MMAVLAVWTARASFAAGVDDAYLAAKQCAGDLKVSKDEAANHEEWDRCVTLFEGVAKGFPASDRAPQALFSAGKLRVNAWGRFRKPADVDDALRLFNELIRAYPKSALSDDALFLVGRLRHDPLGQDDRARTAFSYILEHYPDGDMTGKAKSELALLGEGPSAAPQKVSEPREKAGSAAAKEREPFSADVAGPHHLAVLGAVDVERRAGETTVVLTLTQKAAYSIEYTEQGLRTRSPPRLEMLLQYTRPSGELSKEMTVNSGELSWIKIRKSLLGGGVKLIFELAPEASYAISTQGERITVSFSHAGSKEMSKKTSKRVGGLVRGQRTPGKVPGKALVFVLDPGHGGSDTGAIGPGGTQEKDVTLVLSRRLAERLQEEAGVRVVLTRDDDRALSLEERDAIAVAKKADLFVSVHANASTNPKMSGVETYYLNNASDAAAARLAQRENRSARKKLSDVQHILSTMLQNFDAAESQLLAVDVQGALMTRLSKRYAGVQNRRVRSALFYVLVGAKCPAILVEASFISNPKEERRLKNRVYQTDIASAVADGIRRYVRASDRRMVSL